MKKLYVILAALFVSAAVAFAGENLRPEAGKFGVEVQFNPFSNSFQTFKLNGANIQGRYFLSDKNAIRFNVGIGMNSDKEGASIVQVPVRDDFSSDAEFDRAMEVFKLDMRDYERSTTGDFSVGAGYERHFPFGKRLDVYAGAQLGIVYHFAAYKSVSNCYTGESDLSKPMETWVEVEKLFGASDISGTDPESTLGVSCGVFSGVDVYVFKGMYLGAELGLYATERAYLGVKYTEKTTQKGADPSKAEYNYATNASSFNLGFRCIPSLRLGWTF